MVPHSCIHTIIVILLVLQRDSNQVCWARFNRRRSTMLMWTIQGSVNRVFVNAAAVAIQIPWNQESQEGMGESADCSSWQFFEAIIIARAHFSQSLADRGAIWLLLMAICLSGNHHLGPFSAHSPHISFLCSRLDQSTLSIFCHRFLRRLFLGSSWT